MIDVPADVVNFDLDLLTNPDDFDGFRYYKMRQNSSTGNLAHTQFVSANDRDRYFGYGKHACPGRFFAANELKVILAQIILGYDIMMGSRL